MTQIRRVARWIAHRYWPLIPWALTILAVWWAMEHHEFTPRDPIDAYILFGIGMVFLLAVIFMVVWTERWTWRGLGQLAAYLADAGLYGGAGSSAIGWRHPLTMGELNLIRAMFIVGGTLLVIGLVWWGARERGQTTKTLPSNTT